MKKLIFSALALTLAGCQAFKSAPAPNPNVNWSAPDVVSNEIVYAGDRAEATQILSEMNVKATFIEIAGDSYQVRYEDSTSAEDVAGALAPAARYVEPNYKLDIQSSMNKAEWPTDKFFFKQWAMNNIGQSTPFGLSGDRGADLDMVKAWKVSRGSREVIVAVVDTGIDYKHPDLKANVWINEPEAETNGGVAGKDDDGNGYVDDVYGFDFTSMNRTELFYGVPGDADPMDEDGHGTHCAGAIGAVADNDIGVVGINANVRLMAVKGLTGMGGNTADLARAVMYAVKNKADVISASWGGGGRSQIMQESLREAEKAGVLFVAAAGNDSRNNDVSQSLPATYDKDENGKPFTNIVSVGASDSKDAPAYFSNYGHKTVDVYAPGVGIISTYPTGLTDEGRPPYAVMSGTSMATPYVSGVAALVLAHRTNLRRNPAALRELLIQTCDQKPSLVGRAICNGRVNAYKALTSDLNSDAKTPVWVTQAHSINQRGFNQELFDIRTKIEAPKGSQMVRVHFNFVDINEPYDSVYIYDSAYRLISRIEETDSTDYWSATIPGDTVYVRFVNSLVQKVESESIKGVTAQVCSERGAMEMEPVSADKFACSVDASDSSGKKTKKYNTFSSEGFSVDKIEFVPAVTL